MSERPLSPHLQVYKFFPTMALSICHRITGVGLTFGLLALAYWLTSAGNGEEDYERALALLGTWPVKLLLLAWLAAWCYHFVNGIRHLLWDASIGIEKAQVRRSRWLVVGCAAVGWVVFAWLLFCGRGFQP
jgi:succinate dehydrogenase / fumarate reductase cytochrome b subunit